MHRFFRLLNKICSQRIVEAKQRSAKPKHLQRNSNFIQFTRTISISKRTIGNRFKHKMYLTKKSSSLYKSYLNIFRNNHYYQCQKRFVAVPNVNSNLNKNNDHTKKNDNYIPSVLSNKRFKNRTFSYHSFAIPKPQHIADKNYARNSNDFGHAGEDSYFTKIMSITDENENDKYKSLIIGMADGVGSWKKIQQQNAAHFSQELMRSSLKFINDNINNYSQLSSLLNNIQFTQETDYSNYVNTNINNNNDNNENNNENISFSGLCELTMKYASDHVSNNNFKGASTLCIVNLEFPIINNKKLLHACNLGDSGFAIFRCGLGQRDDYDYIDDSIDNTDKLSFSERMSKAFQTDFGESRIGMPDIKPDTDYYMLYRSPTQIQDFGIPYQLGSHSKSNKISDATSIKGIELKSEDIIIIATDGLWDNLFSNEMANIISETMNKFDKNKKENNTMNSIHKYITNGELTHRLIKCAYEYTQHKRKTTPWSLYMTDTVDMIYDGGKPDDITCCVVYIH